jgi:anti-sigma factor RsiW
MSTLRQFSEKDKDYFAYQARQNYIRQQMSVYGELDATRQAKNDALLERDAALAERDAAAAEIERLKALLAEKK